MQLRKILLTSLFITIFTVVLLLIAAGFIPPGENKPIDVPVDQGAASTESPAVLIAEETRSAPTASSTASLEVTALDGQSLIEIHCTQCHPSQSLGQTEKTRDEWEVTLEKMEIFGVNLDDNEKMYLLDYLTSANR
jgi:hypothetical protein